MLIDWNKILEAIIGPLLGTLIGGGITIASLYFKEYFDRRREVQAWFEQQYITEGFDPLLHYLELALINLRIQRAWGAGFGFVPDHLAQPPSEALLKVCHLIRHAGFSGSLIGVVAVVENALRNPLSPDKLEALEKHMDELCIYLSILRSELMKLRWYKKSDAYNLDKSNKDISLALQFFSKEHAKTLLEIQNLHKGEEVSTNRQSDS